MDYFGSVRGKKKSESLNLLLSMSMATEMRVSFGASTEIAIWLFGCVVIHHHLQMQDLKGQWHGRKQDMTA